MSALLSARSLIHSPDGTPAVNINLHQIFNTSESF